MKLRLVSAAWSMLGAVALACVLAGSTEAADRRLAGRLDGGTAAAVEQIVEEARAARVPTEPLIATALEGASKHAAPARIVAAVRARAQALIAARESLGPESGEAELVAGAGALLAGVPRDTLVRLRAARSGQSLVVPLVVLADLIARRVPAETAAVAVMSATRSGVRDPDLMRLRERVEQDIRSGTAPAAATLARLRGLGVDMGPLRGENSPRTKPVRTP
jgi:hypothetical protein